MFSRVLSSILLFLFLFGMFANAPISNFSSIEAQCRSTQVSFDLNLDVLFDADCETCHSDDCSSNTKHCMHHCSGMHGLLSLNVEIQMSPLSRVVLNLEWPEFQKIKAPFLEQKVIPPITS